MGRQIDNAKAAAGPAARANSAGTYPSVTSWPALQGKVRPNTLDKNKEGAPDCQDCNKTMNNR